MPRTAVKQTYSIIQQKIAELTAQAEQMKSAEKREVVSKIKEAIVVYGISPQELFGSGSSKAAPTDNPKKSAAAKGAATKAAGAAKTGRAYPKVKPKYRDDAGNTWTGRGSKPRWLTEAIGTGKKVEDFAI